MKKIICLFALVSLFSCNAKDDAKKESNVSIFGNWKLVDWYDDTAKDIDNDGQSSTDLFSQWDGCKKQSILSLENDYTAKIIYTGQANNPKCPPGFQTNDSFTFPVWQVDSLQNTFTIIGDDYLDVYEIVQLTSNTLVLKGSGFFTCCDASISYHTGGYLKFEKQ